MFCAVGSTPSTFNAFTVSFKEPVEEYPIAYSSPETVVIMISVLLEMIASAVVLSVLLPSASFSSTPVSSTKAPLVPEPSSRETTLIGWLALPESDPEPASELLAPLLLPQPVINAAVHITLIAIANNFLFLIIILISALHLFFSNFIIYTHLMEASLPDHDGPKGHLQLHIRQRAKYKATVFRR